MHQYLVSFGSTNDTFLRFNSYEKWKICIPTSSPPRLRLKEWCCCGCELLLAVFTLYQCLLSSERLLPIFMVFTTKFTNTLAIFLLLIHFSSSLPASPPILFTSDLQSIYSYSGSSCLYIPPPLHGSHIHIHVNQCLAFV